MSPPTNFPRFPDLPLELRTAIWSNSLYLPPLSPNTTTTTTTTTTTPPSPPPRTITVRAVISTEQYRHMCIGPDGENEDDVFCGRPLSCIEPPCDDGDCAEIGHCECEGEDRTERHRWIRVLESGYFCEPAGDPVVGNEGWWVVGAEGTGGAEGEAGEGGHEKEKKKKQDRGAVIVTSSAAVTECEDELAHDDDDDGDPVSALAVCCRESRDLVLRWYPRTLRVYSKNGRPGPPPPLPAASADGASSTSSSGNTSSRGLSRAVRFRPETDLVVISSVAFRQGDDLDIDGDYPPQFPDTRDWDRVVAEEKERRRRLLVTSHFVDEVASIRRLGVAFYGLDKLATEPAFQPLWDRVQAARGMELLGRDGWGRGRWGGAMGRDDPATDEELMTLMAYMASLAEVHLCPAAYLLPPGSREYHRDLRCLRADEKIAKVDEVTAGLVRDEFLAAVEAVVGESGSSSGDGEAAVRPISLSNWSHLVRDMQGRWAEYIQEEHNEYAEYLRDHVTGLESEESIVAPNPCLIPRVTCFASPAWPVEKRRGH